MQSLGFLALFATTFIITYLAIPIWTKRAIQAGLSGTDVHKQSQHKVAEMGGLPVLLGFIISVMGFVALRIFIFKAPTNISSILAILTAVLLAAMIGIIDDILGWKIGLRQWQKPVLTLLVALPLMAVNGGVRIMSLPILGDINLGLLYPLIIIPGILLVSTNGFNMLAGYNGLEATQGMLLLAATAALSYRTQQTWLTVISLSMIVCLVAFWCHNRYPAKIFPGDTLTYSVGALFGAIIIFGNFERAYIILFIPYIIEFFLKLRGKFQKESFASLQSDGTLRNRYPKWYGLEHVVISSFNRLKIRCTEKRVVWGLCGIQLLFVVLALV